MEVYSKEYKHKGATFKIFLLGNKDSKGNFGRISSSVISLDNGSTLSSSNDLIDTSGLTLTDRIINTVINYRKFIDEHLEILKAEKTFVEIAKGLGFKIDKPEL